MEDFIGKNITLFLDGGWSIYGTVQDMNNKFVIVSDEDRREIVVFKEKISYMVIGEKSKYEPKIVRGEAKNLMDEEEIKYSYPGFSIPSNLLDPSFEEEEDLSVSFGSNLGSEKVTFSIKED